MSPANPDAFATTRQKWSPQSAPCSPHANRNGIHHPAMESSKNSDIVVEDDTDNISEFELPPSVEAIPRHDTKESRSDNNDSTSSRDSSPKTPERPGSAIRYNTPVTPKHRNVSRQRPLLPPAEESESIISLEEHLNDLSINSESSTTGLGLGEVKGGTSVQQQRRISATRPQPFRHRPRLPSWHATSKDSVSIICESITQIENFTVSISSTSSENTDSTNFKLFLDANKEIVRAWRMIKDEELKKNVRLWQKVDCIHAILAAWNKDVDAHGSWVLQAMELTTLDVDFAKEWRLATGWGNEELDSLSAVENFSPIKLRKSILTDTRKTEDNEEMEYIPPPSVQNDSDSPEPIKLSEKENNVQVPKNNTGNSIH